MAFNKTLSLSRFYFLCGLLFLGAFILFAYHSGSGSLWDIDEPNNAQALKEMFAQHNFVLPLFNGTLRVAKPALNYWLMWGGVEVFGMNSWGLRMGSVLVGALFVLYLTVSTRRLIGSGPALLTGLVAATILHSQIIFRAAVPDPLLILFVSMSLISYLHAYQFPETRSFNILLSYAAMALATVDEGPIGFLIPGLIIVVFLLLRGNLPYLWKEGRLQWGLPLFLLIGLPWYVAVGVESHWRWDLGFLLRANISRYNAEMQGHQGPFFYYLLTIPLALLPWSVFLPQAMRPLWRKRKQLIRQYPVDTFLLSWLLVWVIFFSISATKLPNYVWEAYPPLFIFLGRRFYQALSGEIPFRSRGLYMSLSVLFSVGAALVYAGAIIVPAKIPPLGSLYYLGLPYAVSAVLAALWVWKDQVGRWLITLTAGAAALTFVLMTYTEPALNILKPSYFMGEKIRQYQGDKPYSIAAWHWFQPNFLFYAGRGNMILHRPRHMAELQNILRHNPSPLYLVLPSRDVPDMRRSLPDHLHIQSIYVSYELYNHENLTLLRISPQSAVSLQHQAPSG
ncbi:ArnT family glycosyltransferase [Acidithiobacillus albertensis]|uniref:ArnT family glycosyltransferase n=1 Tax=Acidithiobacillus albertensis TaxID=119978 RepID=UPI00094AFB15|nr:glycosyltransferase family 39 protein [Acidithiobacillus albertensis]